MNSTDETTAFEVSSEEMTGTDIESGGKEEVNGESICDGEERCRRGSGTQNETTENTDSAVSAACTDANFPSESESESDEASVKRENSAMREELRREIAEELAEFRELYPEIPYEMIPEAVRKSELPLAAAYALYEKRAAHVSALAKAENQKNAERSAGGLQQSEEIRYTPAEVRQMTRAEVRANYDSILKSMQRWKSE